MDAVCSALHLVAVTPPEWKNLHLTADTAEARQALQLPLDVTHRSSDALVASLKNSGPGVTYVARSVGCGPVVLAQKWNRSSERPIVYVTASNEQLAKAVEDFQALSPDSLLIALHASESNPYASTQPDRRTTMSRLAALTQLGLGRP